MLRSRRRFATIAEIESELTGGKKAPELLTDKYIALLGLPTGTKLEKISTVNTRGVGATQCKPLILHFNDDQKLFLKVTPAANCSSSNQKEADNNIIAGIRAEDKPLFALMQTSCTYRTSEHQHEFLFFPFVPGNNLYIAVNHEHRNNPDNQLKCYYAVGKVIADMHISCMIKNETFDSFIETSDGTLPKVLVHDDWQSTNVMVTPDFKGVIIDTEGTCMCTSAYRNFKETREMACDAPGLMQSFLEGYLASYPESARAKILSKIQDVFANKFKKPLRKGEVPSAAASSSNSQVRRP